MVKNFVQLKANLKKNRSKHKKIKIALLADSATQLFSQALTGYGYEEKLNLNIYEADFDQIDRQIFNNESELYKFNPDVIIIFESTQKLTEQFYNLNETQKKRFAVSRTKRVEDISKVISKKLNAKLIYLNACETQDGIFGNYASKVNTSLPYQLRKFNYMLSNLSQKHKNLFLIDLDLLFKKHGEEFSFDPKFYINSTMALSIDILPYIVKQIVEVILVLQGRIKKCVIVDLDNTLWGGVIGDDGIENIQLGSLGIGKAFSQLQQWLKELAKRGIILAVCSKNDEKIAKEPFLKHPDMVLKINDFAIFVANWNSKIQNVKSIQKFLNIGFDSIVFIDDNPLEREVIKKSFPQITVPDLPQDPALFVSFLKDENPLETASFSNQDKKRTKSYQQDTKRISHNKTFRSEEEFLKDIKMKAKVQFFKPFDMPRITQLTQRSNQFNLRTVRYSEEEIKKIASSKNFITFSVYLEDKFGDLGLISVVILEKKDDHYFIDTWIMSCRVLGRTVEHLLLNHIVTSIKKHGINRIVGQYIKTEKNGLVKDHFKNLGFNFEKGLWHLNFDNWKKKNTFISTN